jgi:hypothetical protein
MEEKEVEQRATPTASMNGDKMKSSSVNNGRQRQCQQPPPVDVATQHHR